MTVPPDLAARPRRPDPADDQGGPSTTATIGDHRFEVEGHPDDTYLLDVIRRTGTLYEADLLAAFAALPLAPGTLAVDVGANIGNHTLYLAGVLDVPVVAVEPHRGTAAVLRRNLVANGLAARVRVVEAALGAAGGTVGLVQHLPGNGGAFRTVPDGDVPRHTLADVVGVDERVGIVKIDVEGDELDVLDGAHDLLARDLPFLAVEAHGTARVRDVLARLAPLGYRQLGTYGRSDTLLFGADDRATSRLAPTTEALTSHDERRRHREVVTALDALRRSTTELTTRAGTPDHGDDDLRLEVAEAHRALERRGDEVARLRRRLAVAEERAVDEAAFARRALRTTRQLRREIELWRGAYGTVAGSRALQAARRVRRVGARLGVVEAFSDPDVAAKDRQIRRAARREGAGVGARLPRGRGAHLTTLGRPPVRVAIASMPSRVDGLERVVAALLPQVDELCVHLNAFPEVPAFLLDPAIRVVNGPDLGDRGKFGFLDGFDGYYLTCDDDIAYPPYYVAHLVDGIERYGRQAVVGWHGSRIKAPFTDYYTPESRQVLTFWKGRRADNDVHILGTGCTGFHTDTIRVRADDFPSPNVADVHLARLGQEQQVPFVVLAHPEGAARQLDLAAPASISSRSMAEEDDARMNVRARTNALVAGRTWQRFRPVRPPAVRPDLSVAIVGRVDEQRWRKGGILRSCHLTARMLASFGVHVEMVDLETDGIGRQRSVDADVVLVYPGDPQRPDFAPVEALVEHHAAAGRLVLVNLSYDTRPERTAFIVDRMRRFDEATPGRVRLLVFTDDLVHHPDLAPIAHLVTALPKTLDLPAARTADFDHSEGVLLGDIGKLCDERLLDHPVEAWIEAIRAALPEVPLFALAQYRPAVRKDLGLRIRPYVPGPLAEDLADVRLVVSPLRFCTFEMVPIELAAAGIPLVHRRMEQSLSSYLGASAVPVDGPDDLLTLLPTIYHDRAVWTGLSRAGERRARSADQDVQASSLYLRVRALVERDRASTRSS